MLKKLLYCLAILTSLPAFAQKPTGIVVQAKIVDGDTLPYIELREVEIFGLPHFKSKSDQRHWEKLVRNVKKVYPYAYLAGVKFKEYEYLLLNAKTDKERKKYIKQVEKELNEKYADELKSLTYSQGKILLKLIDRQTGNSSYDLIKDLKGRFMAFFWQGFARIFGYNLKEKYDPYNKDAQIEYIVRMIENGAI
ncbi:MAG: DUF4294 domain-containing protein [Bacteroidales bacterium]|jgi:hypothetical protein|nr:DUF4294 domain-containing protein [Bacteroidales bacterium]NPV36815.1 DUF4294 domain-containing protein [Bacteroidales bacterium]